MVLLPEGFEIVDKGHRVLLTGFIVQLFKGQHPSSFVIPTSGCGDGLLMNTSISRFWITFSIQLKSLFRMSDCCLMIWSAVWSFIRAGYSAVIKCFFCEASHKAKEPWLFISLKTHVILPTASSAKTSISWFVAVPLQTRFGFGLNLVSAFLLG